MLLAVVLLTVYGQLVIKARAIAHAAEASSGKLPYLVAMFTDVGVLSGLTAAVAASACWMLAIDRLDVAYAYPFMALCFVSYLLARPFCLASDCRRSSWWGLASSSLA